MHLATGVRSGAVCSRRSARKQCLSGAICSRRSARKLPCLCTLPMATNGTPRRGGAAEPRPVVVTGPATKGLGWEVKDKAASARRRLEVVEQLEEDAESG